MQSSSPSVCAVGANGLTVTFVGVGTCSLAAHVSAGSTYAAGTGAPQTLSVGKGTPTTPVITDLPAAALVGHIVLAA